MFDDRDHEFKVKDHIRVLSHYPQEDDIFIALPDGTFCRPRIVRNYSPDEGFVRIELGVKVIFENCDNREFHSPHTITGYKNNVFAHRVCVGT